MVFYQQQGKIPPKRHIAFRKEDGESIYYEELMGNMGFIGISSNCYHIYRPTTFKSTKLLKKVRREKDEDQILTPRHFRLARMEKGGSPVLDRKLVMFNDDVDLWMVHPDKNDEAFYRNAQADECVYVSDGGGVLESMFGEVTFRAGDYVVIPRGIIHRWRLDTTREQRFFVIEGRGHIATPKRYRNEHGQLLEWSPFSERDIRTPEKLVTVDEMGDFEVIMKQRGLLTVSTLDHHPFDLVGWDGFYFPYAFSIHDFDPIVGKIHQPPPVHQTFQCEGFVICSFVPRLYDFHPDSVPAPYHHTNVMSDEVLYYAKSEFMSRKGIEYGSLTLHPDGFTHGPHPGKAEESIGQKETNELAVMVDTFRPLFVAKDVLGVEDREYEYSWLDSNA